MLGIILESCIAVIMICFASLVGLGTIFILYCVIRMMFDKDF